MMKAKLNQSSAGSALASRKKSGGFSLFELVVFIISVAIIYAVAANRFSKFPEAAERANFLAVTTQIQAGVSLESTLGVAASGAQDMSKYIGANPMEMLLSPPRNYLGAFNLANSNELPRRSWYFDLRRDELVYLVNDSENVYFLLDGEQIPTDEIRFEITVNYRYENMHTGAVIANFDELDAQKYRDGDYKRRFSGVLMQPVTPYQWSGTGVDLPKVTVLDGAS
jgi:type II secretory pathway pseudopilin PulG